MTNLRSPLDVIEDLLAQERIAMVGISRDPKDGATNSTARVVDPNANGPSAVAVNSVTNKIYVANILSGS